MVQGHDLALIHIVSQESQGLAQNIDHPSKRGQSPDLVLRNETKKEVFQSRVPALIHAENLDQGHDHQDIREHVLDQGGDLLYLGIFEGFHLLAGGEAQVHFDGDHDQLQDLEDQVQGKEVIQEGKIHVPDLIQDLSQDIRVAGDLAQDLERGDQDQDLTYEIGNHDLYRRKREEDLGLVHIQKEKEEGQHQGTETEPDLVQSLSQKIKHKLLGCCQFQKQTQQLQIICLALVTSQLLLLSLHSRSKLLRKLEGRPLQS